MFRDFRKFILRGNVVDLAVAVVIGSTFGAIVTALVKDMITPLIAAIYGKPNFSSLHFTVNHSNFVYGDVINAIVTFLVVAFVVFFFVVRPVNHLISHFKAGEDSNERDCPECLSVIPAKAKRCKFCTAVIKPST